MHSHEPETIRTDERQKTLRCGSCGSASVETKWVRDSFEYGEGPEAPRIEATIPLRICGACGFQFTDHVAEGLQHEALCRHLGVLTPGEIVAIRTRHGLSRAQFAALTKLGEATLGRWERGALIQNAAYDKYLRLLQSDENVRRLQESGSTGACVPDGFSADDCEPANRARSA